MMKFVWFWTFWHWSKESHRIGTLLHSPLHEIGTHWDEWFRHEASDADREAIAKTGQSEFTQRQFIAWFCKKWAREAEWRKNRTIPKFVLGQLSLVPPFNGWAAFEKHRIQAGLGGVSAIVLAPESSGEPADVRPVAAVALNKDGANAESKVLPYNFNAERSELEAARNAATSMLKGKGLLLFLALWIFVGKRPYSSWLKTILETGWVGMGAMVLYLLTGPDPDEMLVPIIAVLTGLWSVFALLGLTTAVWQGGQAWRAGGHWSAELEQCQIRLNLRDPLTLKGSSAGSAFCLNSLLAVYRAWPATARRSWLWQRIFRRLNAEAGSWAATGLVTPDGFIKPVMLEPKIRACRQHDEITHIITPHQREALGAAKKDQPKPSNPIGGIENVLKDSAMAPPGFAAEKLGLQIHPCRHIAQTFLAIGDLFSRRQILVNVVAVMVTAVMMAAAPDVREILFPSPPPKAVAPSSPSPYYLWVSLDTKHPKYFEVVLQSGFWADRRAKVQSYGSANGSTRAEISLFKLARARSDNTSDGTVWIERRSYFLTREFMSSERIGRYSLLYLNSLESK
ncbi:MAG TPA: hypothetical protein VG347_10235 [Verrucomicrobiae bacterium]|nr:hypothetical protein [Verrucomicrobiae bacterium]